MIAGEAPSRALRRAAVAALAAEALFGVLCLVTTQVHAVRLTNPWRAAPVDAVVSCAILLLPVVALPTLVRLLAHRGPVPVPAHAARAVLAGCLAGLACMTAALLACAVALVSAPEGALPAALTALLPASALAGAVAALLVVRARAAWAPALARLELVPPTARPDLADEIASLTATLLPGSVLGTHRRLARPGARRLAPQPAPVSVGSRGDRCIRRRGRVRAVARRPGGPVGGRRPGGGLRRRDRRDGGRRARGRGRLAGAPAPGRPSRLGPTPQRSGRAGGWPLTSGPWSVFTGSHRSGPQSGIVDQEDDMGTLLHISSSPRGAASESLAIAEAFLDAYRETHPEDRIEVWDLWDGSLPEFGPAAAAAKMAVFAGADPEGDQARAWADARRAFQRFASADAYLFSVPMWNGGIPYILKQFIDVVSQPGMVFGFDPVRGTRAS